MTLDEYLADLREKAVNGTFDRDGFAALVAAVEAAQATRTTMERHGTKMPELSIALDRLTALARTR